MKTIKINVENLKNRSIVLSVSAPSEGEYQGHKYSNVYLGILKVSDFGEILPSRVKVKTSVLSLCAISVGDAVKFYYDQFGNVEEIDVISSGNIKIE